jgi:hypothetical protein
MIAWMERARSAMRELRNARHGQREAILSAIGDGINLNTVRREIKALTFLDELKKTDLEISRRLETSPFGAIELLARWSAFDSRGALEAAKSLAAGEHSLRSLKSAMLAAKRRYAIPTRNEFLRGIEPSIRKQIRMVLGGRLVAVATPSRRSGKPPIDLLFHLTREGARAPVQSVAAVIVGPYRNAALYSKRRHDELWRAMGMAWTFDHVIVILPAPGSVGEYQRWLADYVLTSPASIGTQHGAGSADADGIRRPSVHVIGIRKS